MGIPSYADRMAGVSGGAVREILKLTQQPDIISFGGGLPSADSFPMEDLKDILDPKKYIGRAPKQVEKLIDEKGQYYRLYTGAFELE